VACENRFIIDGSYVFVVIVVVVVLLMMMIIITTTTVTIFVMSLSSRVIADLNTCFVVFRLKQVSC
jgi:hypothetical protein